MILLFWKFSISQELYLTKPAFRLGKISEFDNPHCSSFLDETQIEAEKNRILVRQLVEMYKHLDLNEKKSKETRKEDKEQLLNTQPFFKEKGSAPAPL